MGIMIFLGLLAWSFICFVGGALSMLGFTYLWARRVMQKALSR